MTHNEFLDQVRETDLHPDVQDTITTLFDTIEDIAQTDVMVAGIFAARLIKAATRVGMDPMEIVAAVEDDLSGAAHDTEFTTEDDYPERGWQLDDEGYLFWGIR